jgi:hypothetical protein
MGHHAMNDKVRLIQVLCSLEGVQKQIRLLPEQPGDGSHGFVSKWPQPPFGRRNTAVLLV